MKIIKGDLIEIAKTGKIDVVIHGCNCWCTMGAGIARQIKLNFPEASIVDAATKPGDKKKLGSYTKAFIPEYNLTIVNAYIQYNYGTGKQISYNNFLECFKRIKKEFTGKKIAYPKIGAGLAGGDWNLIEKIIDEQLKNEEHTLIVL